MAASSHIGSWLDTGNVELCIGFLTKIEFSVILHLAKDDLSCARDLKAGGFR